MISYDNGMVMKAARCECAVLTVCTSPVSITELSRLTHIPRTTVSAAVARLVDAGVLLSDPRKRLTLSEIGTQ